MSEKHTPGPWKAVTTRVTEEIQMFEIAEVAAMRIVPESGGWPKHGTPESDARLIAAAPELLDALKALDSAFMAHTLWNGEPPVEIVQARAAIAKATGTNE